MCVPGGFQFSSSSASADVREISLFFLGPLASVGCARARKTLWRPVVEMRSAIQDEGWNDDIPSVAVCADRRDMHKIPYRVPGFPRERSVRDWIWGFEELLRGCQMPDCWSPLRNGRGKRLEDRPGDRFLRLPFACKEFLLLAA